MSLEESSLTTADFDKAADVLTTEALHGKIHLGICQGLLEMDPFIFNRIPIFFSYTFYGHLYFAQMYACKLFDKDTDSITVPKFLRMARKSGSKFKHDGEKAVLAYLDKAEGILRELTPTIGILRNRRNDFLVHLSPTFVFNRELLELGPKVALAQIQEVLHEGGRLVNELWWKWNRRSNPLRESDGQDYKHAISLMNKQLCAEAKEYDAEFGRHGPRPANARPRDCP
jgi:hypothetical protein